MTDQEYQLIAKEFCDLTEVCWHKSERDYVKSADDVVFVCKECGISQRLPISNPDLRNPVEVLAVVRLLPDFQKFYAQIGSYYNREFHAWMHREDLMEDRTGLLLNEAVEFLRREKG